MIVWAVLRSLASTAALVAVYYLLPLDTNSAWAAATMLVVGLLALGGLVAGQVLAILRSRFPGLRGVEALAVCVPFFLLLFAAFYVVLDTQSVGYFNQPLTRSSALYFTVTVFTTVGFGDITAQTETAQLVVTGQMVADLVIIGIAVKLIVGSVRRTHERRIEQTSAHS
jgi:voltage-gated potassium channel